MQAIVLGSAQDGGRPQLGSRRNDGPDRSATSVVVTDDVGHALLLDASPDLRIQWQRLRSHASYRRPEGVAPLDGVVLTHAHMGHYAGLVHFGPEAMNARRLPCWVTPRLAHFLQANEPWRTLVSGGHIDLRPVDPGETFSPWPGLTVRLIAVPHRDELSDTVAVSVGERLLYLPDLDGWDLWPDAEATIARHQIAFLDATFYADDELADRDMTVIPHPRVTDTITRFGHLAEGRRLVLIHLNESNPAHDPASAEAARVRRAGFEVADEGGIYPFTPATEE